MLIKTDDDMLHVMFNVDGPDSQLSSWFQVHSICPGRRLCSRQSSR